MRSIEISSLESRQYPQAILSGPLNCFLRSQHPDPLHQAPKFRLKRSTRAITVNTATHQYEDVVLKVSDARLAYGRAHALNGVNLEMFAGEILGLLGPNGAGKTSLIRCLSGRQKFDSGTTQCTLPGHYQEHIGIVPQEIALYQDLTVNQNLAVFGRLHDITGRQLRELRMQTLRWAGLEDKARVLVRKLSGGMQRRLNIACSVLHEPRILFLDEPTVGVDPQSRERIYHMLETLLDIGTAILLTTHHLEEAEDRCDRIAIIDQGKILDTGTLEELMERSIGTEQQLRVQFSQPVLSVPRPLFLTEDRHEAICSIENASRDLPVVLQEIQAARLPMENMSLHSPTLQHMFLHLTGKELRE